MPTARQFGIGRPYLGRDPPHVGPIDGQEYASRRGGREGRGLGREEEERELGM